MKRIFLFFMSAILIFLTNESTILAMETTITGNITLNENGGEISSSKRDPQFNDNNNWLTIRNGEGGTRIVSKDNAKELLLIDNFGGIYLNGDLYLNNDKINEKLNNTVSKKGLENAVITVFVTILVLFLILILIILKLRKDLVLLKNKIEYEKVG